MSVEMRTYGHHGTTAGSGHEDLVRVDLVLSLGPLDHVCNGVAVATSVVGQSGLAANVPAASGMGRAGVDDDEAILLGELGVGAAVVVGWSRASAVVNSNDHTGASSKLLGHVNVEASLGRSGAEAGDLGQSTWCRRTLSDSGGRHDGQAGDESREETHNE